MRYNTGTSDVWILSLDVTITKNSIGFGPNLCSILQKYIRDYLKKYLENYGKQIDVG